MHREFFIWPLEQVSRVFISWNHRKLLYSYRSVKYQKFPTVPTNRKMIILHMSKWKPIEMTYPLASRGSRFYLSPWPPATYWPTEQSCKTWSTWGVHSKHPDKDSTHCQLHAKPFRRCVQVLGEGAWSTALQRKGCITAPLKYIPCSRATALFPESIY